MQQKNALILTAAITTFALALIGGTVAGLAQPWAAEAAAVRAEATSMPAGMVQSAYPVSADEAASIAQQAALGGRLTRTAELVNFQGVAAYEVVFAQGTVYVDAHSGTVLYNGAVTSAGAPSWGGEHESHGEPWEHESGEQYEQGGEGGH